MAYRVLITDDSPAMRSFVRRVIELSGFELSACFEAGDGAEALAVLKNEWVDAILTDINMPGWTARNCCAAWQPTNCYAASRRS